jgi:hypothetical protein
MNPLRLAHETLPPTPTINDFTRITPVPGGGGNYRMKIKKMATKRGGGSWLNLCNIQVRNPITFDTANFGGMLMQISHGHPSDALPQSATPFA